jgi:WD40 repeat protein
MACTMANSKTVIKIADVELGAIKIVLRGHHDLIHDLSWSDDDNYLVSASADGSCKVWDLTQKETDYADKLNYTENDAMFFICQLLHSSYVYAARILPGTSSLSQNIIVATACFDGKVRLWSVSTDEAGINA